MSKHNGTVATIEAFEMLSLDEIMVLRQLLESIRNWQGDDKAVIKQLEVVTLLKEKLLRMEEAEKRKML